MTKGYHATNALTIKKNNSLLKHGCGRRGPAFVCKHVKDVLQPEARDFRALLIPRALTDDIQEHVDALVNAEAFGDDQATEDEVLVSLGDEARLKSELTQKARGLSAFVVRNGIPEEIGNRIEKDVKQIGMILTKLIPTAKKVGIALMLVGENSCNRWHRDHDVCRALVSYNSCATRFVGHESVDFVESHRGTFLPHLRDESQAVAAEVGDILIMKGAQFPTQPNGLVHKSPDAGRHPDGSVMNRLLLRVSLN